MNQRDQNPNHATADQQSNNRSDRDITQQVRTDCGRQGPLDVCPQRKSDHPKRPGYAEGPVRSEDEKHAVEQKAAGVAGEGKVTSELSVKPKS
jgi:osmotically-inducible protein OsmY